jgi:hypothetical protein
VSFLFPIAALGLLTLPIILILHLLRNRRQQLPIPSLELWRGLQQKKHGALPRSIPLSLMLMLQLFIATVLTLALAQPVFSFLLNQPRQLIFILDTTTSMMAEDGSPNPGQNRRFDMARQVIQEQLQALSDQDTFAVIGLNSQPEILLSGSAEQRTQALLALDNLVPGATGLDLPAALTLANGLVDLNRLNQIIILTDGNYTIEANALPPILAPVEWQIIPASRRPSASSNQALLNVSARMWPDGRHRLFARVINYSDETVARTMRVLIGERLFAETTVQLEPQAETARAWTLPESAETAAVEIVEPDALPLDNRAELLLLDTARYRVLLVSETPATLARALEAQPGVELTIDAPSARTHDPDDFDLTVFEGMGLPIDLTTWPKGNIWVVSPPLGHPLLPAENYTRNLRPDPATASTLLTSVDLSGVYFNRVHQLTLPTWANVDLTTASAPTSGQGEASFNPGQPLIFHGSVGDTRLVVWAFDLAASNLPARLALPLLTANTLQTLLSPAPQSVVPLGEPVPINGNFRVEIPGGRRLFPTLEEKRESQVFAYTQQPGLYKIYNDQNEWVAGFAVHAGSALESNLTMQLQPDTFNSLREPASRTLNTPPPQTEYYDFWPWLAGLALTVVIIEGWLAWRK